MKIDKNIPIPEDRKRYPWKEMEVGDSFFIEGKEASQIGGIANFANRTYKPKHFITRTVKGGVRIWRDK